MRGQFFFLFIFSAFLLKGQADLLSKIRQVNTIIDGQELCTPAYLEQHGLADQFFSQFILKGLSLDLMESRVADNRAYLRSAVLREGRKVDELFFYLVRDEEGEWMLDGVNENELMPAYFLQGLIPGHFDVMSLPHFEELDTFSRFVLIHCRDSLFWQSICLMESSPYCGVLTGKFSSGNYVAGRNYYSASMQRAAIVFTNQQRQNLTLYITFSRKKNSWMVCNYSQHDPRTADFLRCTSPEENFLPED